MGNEFYVSSETKVCRRQSIFFSSLLFPLESDLLPPPILWLAAVTSDDMLLFRKRGRREYAKGVKGGGELVLFDTVVHMSSGNGKYCVGNVARHVSNFATSVPLLSIPAPLSKLARFGMAAGAYLRDNF